MAEGKRYYWLRLHDDFFSSKRIKKLRKMAGGDTYTIIYLKMQLKAIKTDGILEYTGLESSIAEEIALDLDETVEDVQVTITYLLSCGLAESSDLSIFLPFAVENTGSEGASAQRNREYRDRKRHALVTLPSQCDTSVTEERQTRDGEIEKEKEKEKDITVSNDTVCRIKDIRRVIEAWNSLGLTQVESIKGDTKRGTMLRCRVNEYGIEKVIGAIERIKKSDYLRGQNSKGWVISLEWFAKPNNFIKVMEGQYDVKGDDDGNGRKQSVSADAAKSAGTAQSGKPKWNVHYD